MQLKWLEWAKQIQAISQAGLAYSKDVYDLERFQQLRELSVEIMEQYTNVETWKLQELFAGEEGYATPKVAVRGVAFQDDKILMAKESIDNKWSLPGGWTDVGLSPYEVVVKEIKEETGFIAQPVRLLGIVDKKFHDHPPFPYHVYIIFILCEITGGSATTGVETTEIQFFGRNQLPKLSTPRITARQIEMMFDYLDNPDKPAFCE